ncbi:MAG: hypothetical protein LKG14_00170 [Prevotella sp.]|jgi:hypothetical protein|uniref:Outer membrane protein beta-barrel domain-containing protein n=1 Tax=Segatella cerevisiae TaxID=2053716 RepID=A0ABT1C013_9BACT|nr:hypothetical protein [Segatella cerevisiae]MCH3995818.1 hypothetical protein [Prevotella sp.]MCI1245798.1 hypothetical protein [Prevotella sp.]MCO6026584.1 hypothetical protein [Segatella cerevisiae]
MKKKLFILLGALLLTVTAHAQFEANKTYIGGSLSGLNLNYNGKDNLHFGVQVQVGRLIADNLMVLGQAGYEHTGGDSDIPDNAMVGAGLRYYIIQNGLYLGLNGKLIHANHNYNDLMPGLEVGYAFFLSRTVTLEPAVYYDQSFKNHSDYSTVGFKIGIGVYL